MEEVPDEKLWAAVIEADTRLFNRGMKLRQRQWEIARSTRELIGLQEQNTPLFSNKDGIDRRVDAIFNEIYGERALSGNFGVGLTEFRGVGYLFDLPLAYGTVALNAYEHSDLTAAQKHLIDQDSKLSALFLGTFKQSFQINTRVGSGSTNKSNDQMKIARESLRQYRCACFIIARTEDHADAYQSMCLALEMGLKSLLLDRGYSKTELSRKPYGHNLSVLGGALKPYVASEHVNEMMQILTSTQDLVGNRYGDDPISSSSALKFCLDAQFILSELSIAQYGPCFLAQA